jgi:hypothetical protein
MSATPSRHAPRYCALWLSALFASVPGCAGSPGVAAEAIDETVAVETAAAQMPPIRRRGVIVVDGEEARLQNWSVQLLDINYGDMSDTSWDRGRSGSIGLTLQVKNISASPQLIDNRLYALVNGLWPYTPTQFNVKVPGDSRVFSDDRVVQPGATALLDVSILLTYEQRRYINSITVSEHAAGPEGPIGIQGPKVAAVDLPVPPFRANWADPDLIAVEQPWQTMANWSARIIAVGFGDTSDPEESSGEVVVTMVLKNISATARNPYKHFQWSLIGPEGEGLIPLRMRDEPVPPGGEIIVHANKEVWAHGRRALRSLRLTEHQPRPTGGGLSERTALATVDLLLPAPPAALR